MKAINVNVMKNLDHPDVKDIGGRSEKQRRQYRVGIIKSFLKWAKADETRFADFNSNSDEKILLKRNKGLINSLTAYGMFANFFLYHAVMTGIYNYRIYEVMNMKKIPLIFKMGVTSAITGGMCYALYNDRLYDEDHYRIALKYRSEHDEKYKEYLENEKIGSLKGLALTE
jgi:hypothetical protein